MILSLSTKGRLFADAQPVADNVMSFASFGEFFLYTTRAHTLEVRLLAQPQVSLETRTVETGAIVVAAITQARCVLQMPRGNLETVAPRALLLNVVKSLLDAGEYKQVMRRTHNLVLHLCNILLVRLGLLSAVNGWIRICCMITILLRSVIPLRV